MRTAHLARVALAAIGLSAFGWTADAGVMFDMEKVDSTGVDLVGGALFLDPAGDLVATDSPASAWGANNPDASGAYASVRILVRHAGAWSLHAPALPQDSTAQHDLACDSAGKLYFLGWQGPGTDEARPILEEENGAGWTTTVLDTGTVFASAIAIDAHDRPWIAMLRQMKHGYSVTWAMVIAHRTELGWVRDSLDLPCLPPFWGSRARYPFRLDASGAPGFLFAGTGGTGLLRAERTPGGWQVDTVDAGTADWRLQPALAYDGAGVAHTLHQSGATLVYSSLTGSGWVHATVSDRANGSACDLAFDRAGLPGVVYSADLDPGLPYRPRALCYSRFDGIRWNETAIDDDSTFQYSPRIVLDSGDRPRILFNDPSRRLPVLALAAEVAAVSPGARARGTALALLSRNPSAGGNARWVLTLPSATRVTLQVFDVSGRCLASGPSRMFAAGRTTIDWSPPVFAPGCYFVSARLEAHRTPAVRWVVER